MNNLIAQQILSASAIGYLVADCDLQVRHSAGCDRLLEPAPSIGQSLLDLLPELYGNEPALAAILAGRLSRLHLPTINRDTGDGQLRFLDLLTLPFIDDDGLIGGLIQVISDVTDRGRIEQNHIQQRNELSLLKDHVNRQNAELARVNAELRRANRLKDEFLAAMSHELRTPLTAILGLSEVLHAQIHGPLNTQQLDSLRGIEESGRHLLTLINDLLDLAKIEAGRFTLDLALTSVPGLCKASLRLVSELALKKQLTLTLTSDPQLLLIRVDERRLRQALINLLANAVKFTPPGGTIGLEVTADPTQAIARFTVWDTGIGIAAEQLPHLFQPFSQLANQYRYEQSGSGLGLALVAQLTELHGGSVTLASEPGKGSRFTLALPWNPAEQHDLLQAGLAPAPTLPTQGQATPPVSAQAGEYTLLLVEDHQPTAQMLADYLQHLGYQLIRAGSGEEALVIVRDQLPDLILLDLRMNGIDGLETIKRLRANLATRTIPIIVLTALTRPGDRERCLAAGANSYLSKPLPLHNLAGLVADLLQHRAE